MNLRITNLENKLMCVLIQLLKGTQLASTRNNLQKKGKLIMELLLIISGAIVCYFVLCVWSETK